MAIQIIDRTELTEYGNRSVPMSAFTNTQIDEAIERATDRIRQAALNDYTADSFELLSKVNSPDEIREICFALALAILTRGDAGRPQSIDEANVDATKRLGYIVAGRTYYDQSPGSVLVKLDDGSGSVVTSRAATERKFDRDNHSQKYNLRDGKI